MTYFYGANAESFRGVGGIDTFAFSDDACVPNILSQFTTEDLLDLSGVGVASCDALAVIQRHTGSDDAIVIYEGDSIRVDAMWDDAAGATLMTAANFLVGDLLPDPQPIEEIHPDVNGTDGADTISLGYVDVDVLTNAGQHIFGLGGNDKLTDGSGNDILGGGDKDQLRDGAGDDTVYGGIGNDAVGYISNCKALTLDLRDTSQSSGRAAGVSYNGIESIMTTGYADTIYPDETIQIRGGSGHDMYFYAANAQNFRGEGDSDTFVFGDDGGVQDILVKFSTEDMIDLSVVGITSMSELTITHCNSGSDEAIVSYQNDRIRVDGMWDDTPCHTLLTANNFIFA